MAVRISRLKEMYEWLHRRDVPHVILRDDADAQTPAACDVDLLVSDRELPNLRAYLSRISTPRQGTKVDLYGVRGRHETLYHGHPHLPVALGERTLARRAREGLALPDPEDHLLAFLYHTIYHKCVQSGLDWRDPSRSRATPVQTMLADAARDAGTELPLTLRDGHNHLVRAGFGVTYERLASYVAYDIRHRRKSYFHARLIGALDGEMNLFVIREIAVRHQMAERLVQMLRHRFEIVAVKPVSLATRMLGLHHMRGGKWRRGGRPHAAIVVFDCHPESPTAAERLIHPFVFNANQFVKQEWRSWFSRVAPARPQDNPIHSTDNEAEAIGHLPVFFSAAEVREIFDKVAVLRGRGRLAIGPDEGD